ncbi:DUF397 domain-containing protein [Streptomyces griseocarneus]|nr:DUF397 domain-containing protein [Streptomyces griseocarneus]
MKGSTLGWQKSSYCQESSSCLHVAAGGPSSIQLYESDVPDLILTTSRSALHNLIRTVKAGHLGGAET